MTQPNGFSDEDRHNVYRLCKEHFRGKENVDKLHCTPIDASEGEIVDFILKEWPRLVEILA